MQISTHIGIGLQLKVITFTKKCLCEKLRSKKKKKKWKIEMKKCLMSKKAKKTKKKKWTYGHLNEYVLFLLLNAHRALAYLHMNRHYLYLIVLPKIQNPFLEVLV